MDCMCGVFRRTAPKSYLKGYFWLLGTDWKRSDLGVFFPDADFVTMLRSMTVAAVKTFISDPAVIDRLLTSVATLTALPEGHFPIRARTCARRSTSSHVSRALGDPRDASKV